MRGIVSLTIIASALLLAFAVAASGSYTYLPQMTKTDFSVVNPPTILAVGVFGTFQCDGDDEDTQNDPPVYDGVHATWSFGADSVTDPANTTVTRCNTRCSHTSIPRSVQCKWTTAGVKSVGITCNDDGLFGTNSKDPQSATLDDISVTVIGGPVTASTTELRYYDGGFVPARYTATLTASPDQPTGTTYSWVVWGPARVNSGDGTNQVVLETTGPSGPGGVWAVLTYSLDGASCDSTSPYCTSREPTYYLFQGYDDHDSPAPPGYETFATYWVKDQLSEFMNDINIGEVFDNDRYDYTLNNWPTVSEQGAVGVGYAVVDTMTYWDSTSTFFPSPELSTGNGDAVYGHTQHQVVGGGTPGTGRTMKTDWQLFYRNRGRH